MRVEPEAGKRRRPPPRFRFRSIWRPDAPPRNPDERGRVLRRLLLGADVVAACVSFLAAEFAFGSSRLRDSRSSCSPCRCPHD